MSTKLTAKQVEYLKACANAPQSPWAAASTTVNRLRRYGMIVKTRVDGYTATDAGREWLAKEATNA